MIEAGLLPLMDIVIVVSSPKKLQIERYSGRNSKKRIIAKKIIASQTPIKEKIRHADFHIRNNSSRREFQNKIRNIYRELFEPS